MAIISKERLLKLRFPVAVVLLSAVAFFFLLRLGPRFSAVVSFFWPLLLSTGFFLVAVALLLRISPPPSDAAVDLTGEELIDYVAGQPQEEQEATTVEAEEEEAQQRGGEVELESTDHHRKSE